MKLPVIVAAGLLLWPALAMAENWISVIGTAKPIDGGETLYTEHHRILRENGLPLQHQVKYRDPDGEVIGIKTVDYRRAAAAPEFGMRDTRNGYEEGAREQDGEYRLYTREDADAKEKSKAIADGKDLVADAGFDGFVRQNMARLQAGEKVSFRLAIANSLRTYDFRARKTKAMEYQGKQAVEIYVEPDSLLRWLVDPLTLIYATEPVQLLMYQGRTNIRNPNNGDRYDARIEFGAEQPAAAPEPDTETE